MNSPTQYYVPYQGHPSAKNFIAFRQKGKILFQDDLPNLYKSVLMEDLDLKTFQQGAGGMKH